MEIPMLAVTKTSRPCTKKGTRSTRRIRFAALRDVEEISLAAHRLAAGIPEHNRGVAEPHRSSVSRDQPVLGRQRNSVRAGLRVLDQDTLAIVGMQRLDEERRVAAPLLDRVAEKVLHLRARVDARALVVECVHVRDQGKMLDQRAEAE